MYRKTFIAEFGILYIISMSYIYLITNKVNGKQYVGQHHYDGEGMDVSYKGSGVLLRQAYKKYGVENFTMEVIEYCSDASLDSLEVKYISDYNTKTPNGYNLTDGGGGCKGKKYTDEQIENMRIAQNRPEVRAKHREWATGRVQSEDAKKKLSDKAKERYKNPEKRKEIAEHLNRIRPKSPKEKIFICPLKLAYLNSKRPLLQELADVFDCDKRIVKKRAEKYGIKLNLRNGWDGKKHTEEYKNKMSKRMTGRVVSEETKEKLSLSHSGKSVEKLRKPIKQIDIKTNEIIKVWDGITIAANELKISNSSISTCLSGKYKTAGGYRWEYVQK